MSTRRKQALGKGLGALLSGAAQPHPPAPLAPPAVAPQAPPTPPQEEDNLGELRHIALSEISPNPHQPRRHFDSEALEELATSIRTHGVIQPILVTESPAPGGGYILLAGERRLRASELARQETIPARVITVTESQQLELALIENVQRENLDPVEEARAYEALIAAFGLSQEEVASRVGKSRVAIANALRLLKLPEACLADIQSGALSAGHARAILMLHHTLQQEMLRREILEKGLSVRDAEKRAREIPIAAPKSNSSSAPPPSKAAQQNLDVLALQEKLTLCLGCKVRIRTRSNKSGTIDITYNSLDDLDRVLDLLGVNPDD
ncbi:MAG: ParB family transcriptional regulator, chromosome partitioning protein [Candidatus Sumerlaeota bacterium]|nr:ParB family transcriptional regulator, chromosome partitioning protein [Candidatus Sumerlaeota bacterium]